MARPDLMALGHFHSRTAGEQPPTEQQKQFSIISFAIGEYLHSHQKTNIQDLIFICNYSETEAVCKGDTVFPNSAVSRNITGLIFTVSGV